MVLFSTTLLSGYCRGITALPAAVAAAVVVAAGVAVALPGKRITRRRVLALGCLVCLSLSRSPFLSLCLFGEARVLSTLSSSRACSAAILAARQIRRRRRDVRMCGPPSTRIHHAFFHHVMCLFDTSLSTCIEFISFFSSKHSPCVVISSFPSYPSWA